MSTHKPTADEQRAETYCGFITDRLKYSPAFPVVVEWYKSRTWGMCPRVLFPNHEKVVSATGCGYCKQSTVLAMALTPLGKDEEERRKIARTAGAGVPSLRAALEELGWDLVPVADGPGFDAYHLSALAPAEGEA